MSSRFFQSVILQMKDITDRTVGVLDETGTIVACNDLSKIGTLRSNIVNEISYNMDNVLIEDGVTYKAIGKSLKPEYLVFVEGSDEQAKNYVDILSVSLSGVKELYDEKYDKANFIKNILLDNILPGDIYSKAKELRFTMEEDRVVILICLMEKSDISVSDIISNIFPDKQKDYIINISETEVALVKEIKPNVSTKDLEKLAKSIVETLNAEVYIKTKIGIGTVADNLKDLSRSYKEAQTALEIGKIFENEKEIVCYNNLGIDRLIYQLPTTLCKMFLSEVFKKGPIESLDHETLFTIQKFFENNLNVSETSRKLFVHRNTLVYRLEKIRRLTGLDLREFDDAIVFKVAMMVKKYLSSGAYKF